MFRTAERSTSGKGVFRDAGPREGGLFRSEGPPAGGMERYHVSAVDDPEEISAERTADRVMGGGIFREAGGPGAEGGMGLEGGEAELPSADLAGPGSALPAGLQESMGAAMGADFSNVRVHTGAGADRANRSLSARAFTQGQDVYFRAGEYDPASREGQHLIAHELAHVADGVEGLHRDPTDPAAQTQAPGAPAAQAAPRKKGNPSLVVDTYEDRAGMIEEELNKIDKDVDEIQTMSAGDIAGRGKKQGELKQRFKDLYDSSLNDVKVIGSFLSDPEFIQDITPEQKKRMEEARSKMIELRKTKAQDLKHKLINLERSITAEERSDADVPMPDSVKEMVNSSYFDAFLHAVGQLSGLGESFGEKEEAASKFAKGQGSNMSAEAKRSFIQKQNTSLTTLGQVEDSSKTIGRVGNAVSTVAGAGGELAESAGAVAQMDYIGKHKGDENAEDNGKEKGERVSGSITAASQGFQAIGAGLSAVQNKMDAKEQEEKAAKAKQGMKMIAKRLRSTLPIQQPETDKRSARIAAVCSWVELKKENNDKESLENLIYTAMDDDVGLLPNLTGEQKTLLGSMLAMENSRSAREKKMSAHKKEMYGNIIDAASSALQSIGGFMSTFLDNSLWGSVLSLAGGIIGQGKGVLDELTGEGGEEEDENGNKLAASRSAIQQMAALPTLEDAPLKALKEKAGGKDTAVNGQTMAIAEKYAMAFYTIETADVNMSDVLFAIEKGGFGKQTGTAADGSEIKKSTDASLRDMYKNLSFS